MCCKEKLCRKKHRRRRMIRFQESKHASCRKGSLLSFSLLAVACNCVSRFSRRISSLPVRPSYFFYCYFFDSCLARVVNCRGFLPDEIRKPPTAHCLPYRYLYLTASS